MYARVSLEHPDRSGPAVDAVTASLGGNRSSYIRSFSGTSCTISSRLLSAELIDLIDI
jgi:hypothetical protein